MAWKDNLRPASFRGIPFYVDSSQKTGGRRVQFHEFPDRDNPYAEDLGRVGKTYKIDGHILGDDYDLIKKQLEQAADKDGPGELIHPYFGTLFVQLGAFSIDEDTKEGRIAKVSFQFYETTDLRYPKPLEDKAKALSDASENAKAASKKSFDKKFSITKLAGSAVETARNGVKFVADTVQNATKGIQAEIQGIADLAFSIKNFKAEVDDLLQSPSKLSQRLLDNLALLEEAVGAPVGRFQAHSTMFEFVATSTALKDSTPTRAREKSNDDALNTFVRQTAIANAANQTSEIDFESTEEAIETREQLRELIEIQLLTTDDDDVYQAFNQLLAEVVRTLPDIDSELPGVQEKTITEPTPSLILAYDLFETIESEEDILARNKIIHPAFISGNIEVVNVREGA
jgi:prophage DNA circulation protein